jgi:hypothetical protein
MPRMLRTVTTAATTTNPFSRSKPPVQLTARRNAVNGVHGIIAR